MIEQTLTGLIDRLTERKDRFYGVVVGRVVEVVTDEMSISRVKLALPFLDSQDVSPWARVAVPAAGPSSGTYFIPNVDDEVLVAFEHGDVNAPYILGCLWNSAAPPPLASPAERTWLIRTQVGNTIAISELAPEISIETATGDQVRLSENGIEIDSGGNRITINPDGIAINGTSVRIEGSNEVIISAPRVAIDGGLTAVSANGDCAISGNPVRIN